MIYRYILFLGLVLALASCETVSYISVDCLQPADVNFPQSLQRVGVVNNMLGSEGGAWRAVSNSPDSGIVYRAVAYPEVNGPLAVESLAQTIADRNYFHTVAISDSALRENDRFARTATLTPDEVDNLAAQMDVDFILALETVDLKALKTVNYLYQYMVFRGVVDLNMFVKLTAYVPGLNRPMFSIAASDSIFWETYGVDDAHARTHIVSDEQLVEEASAFAGALLVDRLLPHWQTLYRPYFASGTPAMRAAAVYMSEQNWRDARALWLREYESVRRKKIKLFLAHNIALSYELDDQIDQAIEWAEKARGIALELGPRKGGGSDDADYLKTVPHYAECDEYVALLRKRKADMQRLSLQLQERGGVF